MQHVRRFVIWRIWTRMSRRLADRDARTQELLAPRVLLVATYVELRMLQRAANMEEYLGSGKKNNNKFIDRLRAAVEDIQAERKRERARACACDCAPTSLVCRRLVRQQKRERREQDYDLGKRPRTFLDDSDSDADADAGEPADEAEWDRAARDAHRYVFQD